MRRRLRPTRNRQQTHDQQSGQRESGPHLNKPTIHLWIYQPRREDQHGGILTRPGQARNAARADESLRQKLPHLFFARTSRSEK